MANSIRILGKSYELPSGTDKSQWKLTSRPGGWWIAEGPAGERIRLSATRARNKLSLSIDGTAWQGEVLAKASRDGGADTGVEADLISQFPGKVGKLLVAEGQAVVTGEPLLLVEAMKMEFAIKAPYAGKIKKILVQAGQQLAPGDRFLEIEPSASTGPSGTGGQKS